MDSDEWDDDIADEDLITALTQTSQTGPEAPHASTSTAVHLPPPRSQPGNPSASLRQTTLWGAPAPDQNDVPQPQVQSKRPYRADMPIEPPTHHKLNHPALETWIYPTNLGPVRDYQYSIVKNGLFNNTLVALPTGLGKTFIAATVMLNFFRWTQDAKLIFVAPTKPLASQQVEACLNVAGIPRSQATLLTGETSPALREGEWEKRRLFFMTPQTLQNDLSKGYANPKAIALLVIDEAHRATGDYAYVKVVEFLRRFNPSFRVLALTATPGSTVEGVQAVIDSLGISTIEIRTEESIDIRRYVHSREVDQVVLEPSDEMLQVQDLFSQTLRPLCNKLAQVNKWLARDPMTLTVMGLREAQRQWLLGAGRHANPGTKSMIMAVFTILQSLAHGIKLLNYHGIAPFCHKMVDFRSEVEEKGSKSKYKQQIIKDENFQEMMDTIEKWLKLEGFVGHPKLSYLCQNLLNHFMDAGEGSSTRAIVFSEYRDSAEEIVRALNKHKPMIKATIFVGQADSKRSEGMKQKQQIETIKKFRSGEFNVLVATSIGEEGLDIGQVDLIVCYDASASPIRMLQRMGRTGRKRAGNITLLLMKGREEEQYRKAKDNYEKMQRFICEGTRFKFRNDLSSRIVPRGIKPEVDMRLVDIPIENTQNTSLPEPKKGTTTRRKKPTQKKFHMPDGVVTGFLKASDFGNPSAAVSRTKLAAPNEADRLAEIPSLDTVLLNRRQMVELDQAYRNLPAQRRSQEDVTGPNLGAHPKAQRKLGPVVKVKHGAHTKRCVKLFKALANAQTPRDRYVQPYSEKYQSGYKRIPLPTFANDTDDEAQGKSSKRQRTSPVDEDVDEDMGDSPPKKKKVASKPKMGTRRRSNPKNPFIDPGDDDEDDDSINNNRENVAALAREKRPKSKAKGKGKSRGGAVRSGRNADIFEDYGDDCTRTSQLYESDGSDSGADLVDFIDDGPVPSMHPSSSLTSTSPAAVTKLPAKKREEGQAFYEFMSIASSQGSDDDLASLSQLGRPKLATKPVLSESDEEETELQKRPSLGRRKRQTVMDESEDDYE